MSEVIFYNDSEQTKGRRSEYAKLVLFCLIWPLIPFIACYAFYLKLKFKNSKYKITSQFVQHEFGVLSKTTNTLELWRVKDLQFRQSITQRMFGECTLVLATQDVSNPIVLVEGLPGTVGREIFDKLQKAIPESRKDNRAVSLTG